MLSSLNVRQIRYHRSFLNVSEIRFRLGKHQDFYDPDLQSRLVQPTEQKTIGIGGFATQSSVRNFACKQKESRSKLSKRKLINKYLINIQQVRYIFDFLIDFYTFKNFTLSFFVN